MTAVLAERVKTSEPRTTAVPFAAAVVALALIGAVDGGYFPGSWGWITLALLWVAAVGLLVGLPRPTAMESVLVFGLAAVCAATVVSFAVASGSALEPQRALVYLAGALAALAVLRRSSVATVVAGLLCGITVVTAYGLATRLLPDRLGSFDSIAGYRLAEPLGYWNALGVLAAMGLLLGAGVAARSESVAARVFAAATLVPNALALYFTFSRGAWIALGIGLLVAVAVDPLRVRFVTTVAVLAPWPALAIYAGSQRDALTTVDAPLAEATAEGRDVIAIASVLLLVAAATAVAIALAERRVNVPARVAKGYAVALVAASVVALGAVSFSYGAPWTIASNAWSAFSAPPPQTGGDLNQRLFSFSGSGRVEQWEVALDAWRSEPLLGIGAGEYERYWLEHREVAGKIRDAHSLYLETLSELGPLGLVLLLLALGVPVYAAFKARRHPLVPAAFGAYVAYLVHAGVDWDWEMPAVTLTALFIGASIVVAARKPEDEERPMGPRLRYGLLAGTLLLAAVAFVGLVGNMALAQSADAARAGDWGESESRARRAATWAPWSPEPWQKIGEAQLARGELAAAQASFRKAIAKDERDWELWLDLARASEGPALERALAEATRLNPLSPEVAQLRKELAELGTIEVGG